MKFRNSAYWFRTFFSLAALLALLVVRTSTSLAASGLPSSAEFGFGAEVDEHSSNVEGAILIAQQTGFDWLSVDFDWSSSWPTQQSGITFSQVKRVADLAHNKSTNLMISIKNPPAWALDNNGPSASAVVSLVRQIAAEFPDTVLAFELFPGANRAANWGAQANPGAYAQVIRSVQEYLFTINPRAIVIATVTPLGENQQVGDIEDTAFLSAFYKAEISSNKPLVVGIYYQLISGDPARSPAESPAHSLRHYEQVRDVMKQANHSDDLIWVTGFSWPAEISDSQAQAKWVLDAYKQLQGQLFIGAAFFNKLNSIDDRQSSPYLIGQYLTLHPATQMIRTLIGTGQAGSQLSQPASSAKPGAPSFLDKLIEVILSWFKE